MHESDLERSENLAWWYDKLEEAQLGVLVSEYGDEQEISVAEFKQLDFSHQNQILQQYELFESAAILRNFVKSVAGLKPWYNRVVCVEDGSTIMRILQFRESLYGHKRVDQRSAWDIFLVALAEYREFERE